jgi:tetratricopeptide (TPR) repeat protein
LADYELSLAQLLHQRGAYDEALAVLEKVFRLDSPGVGWFHVSRILIGARRFDAYREGLLHHERSFPDHPVLPKAWCALAHSLRRTRRPSEALAAADKAIELDETFSAAHSERARALCELVRFPEALSSCRRAAELDPDSHEVQYILGHVLCKLGRYEESLEPTRRAVEMEPSVPTFRRELQPEELTTGISRASCLANLGWLLATVPDPSLRDPEEAVRLAERALALGGWDFSRKVLGVALYRMGRFEDAVAALATHVSTRGETPSACYFLAMALQRLGRDAEARAWLDRGIRRMEDFRDESGELKRFRAEAEEVLSR